MIDYVESSRSSASSPLEGVSCFPGCPSGWSGTVSTVSLLPETSVFLTGGGKTTELSFVVFFRDDPVDSWVDLDSFMRWVNHNDLEEFVGGVLTHPVGVENSEVGASSSDLLLSDRSVRSDFLELSNTLVDWLTEDDTLMDCSLSSSSSDSHSVDDIALLLFESEGSRLVESGWLGGLVADWKLSVLPASDSHDESDGVEEREQCTRVAFTESPSTRVSESSRRADLTEMWPRRRSEDTAPT